MPALLRLNLSHTVAAIALSNLLISTAPAEQTVASSAEGTGPTARALAASDWSSIRAAYEAGRHAVAACAEGHQARNPGQQWRTHFDGRGFLVTPDAGVRHGGSSSWSWGLELISFGRAGDERPVPAAPMCIRGDRQRVEYEWDDGLTEWYINDTRGLEHGYTVNRRPCANQSPDREGGVLSSSRTECSLIVAAPVHRSLTVAALNDTSPLHLTLAIRGQLRPRITPDGRSVAFVNTSGAVVMNYSGLTVFDADGRSLSARFESCDDGLRLTIDDARARYPLTIDPIAQQAYLKASNTGGTDEFGQSVAVSGDTVVIGAWLEDSSAIGVNGNQSDNSAADSGAVYVFVRDGSGNWSQQAYLKASNTGAGDYFGYSVAVSGDTVVVGAYAEDSASTGVNGIQSNESALNAGAAYVFARSGATRSQQANLTASNTAINQNFGASVSVSGNTVVVGAPEEDNGPGNSGAVYIFIRNGTSWSQEAYLKASNPGENDEFGWVAVFADTVVVGARGEDSGATGVNGNQADNNAIDAGAAYVFVRNGGQWSQQAYLKASNSELGDRFGSSVAVSDDMVVVGAYNEDSSATDIDGDQADNNATLSGAAYVFVRAAEIWSQQTYLKASNTDASDFFGYSVAVSGDLLVVGAYGEDSSTTGVDGNQSNNSAAHAGAAYVFLIAPDCPGSRADANCDATVDFFDIDPFLQALFDPPSYAAAFCGGSTCAVDVDCSGGVDFFDIDPFLACLFSTCPPCA